jgi:phosphopantothenoylcysteine synthetase/decarboxylase
LQLLRALALRGAEVTLIYGNIQLELPYYLKEAVFCESAAKCMKQLSLVTLNGLADMLCSRCGLKPKEAKSQKLPKQEELNLELVPTVR